MKSNPTRAGSKPVWKSSLEPARGMQPASGGNERRRRGQVKTVRGVSRFGSDGGPSSQAGRSLRSLFHSSTGRYLVTTSGPSE